MKIAQVTYLIEAAEEPVKNKSKSTLSANRLINIYVHTANKIYRHYIFRNFKTLMHATKKNYDKATEEM